MNRITCPKTSLSYSANTLITSEERKPLYNEQNNYIVPRVTLFRGSTVHVHVAIIIVMLFH